MDSWAHPAWAHPRPGWLHYCNVLGADLAHYIGPPGQPINRMAVIVAASVEGCRVWRGLFQGHPKEDGDLEHIREQLDAAHSEILPAGIGYLLSPDCVHESLVFEVPTQRQFLRLAFAV